MRGLDCVPELVVCSSQVYQFNVPTFGPGVVFDVDYSVRMEQYRFFTEALTVKRLKSYVEMMVEEAEVRACVFYFFNLMQFLNPPFFPFIPRPCVSEDEKVVDLCQLIKRFQLNSLNHQVRANHLNI
jgi:hypothetical protein